MIKIILTFMILIRIALFIAVYFFDLRKKNIQTFRSARKRIFLSL